MKKIVVSHNKTIQVFRLGKTANKKICSDPKVNIVQSYTYSLAQYAYIQSTKKPDFKKFFDLANTNCLDCPFSTLQHGGCYTHKYMQYTGFISQLRSLKSSEFLTYGEQTNKQSNY